MRYMQTQRPGGGGRDDGGARHDGGGTRCSIVSGAPGHRHAADVALVSARHVWQTCRRRRRLCCRPAQGTDVDVCLTALWAVGVLEYCLLIGGFCSHIRSHITNP